MEDIGDEGSGQSLERIQLALLKTEMPGGLQEPAAPAGAKSADNDDRRRFTASVCARFGLRLGKRPRFSSLIVGGGGGGGGKGEGESKIKKERKKKKKRQRTIKQNKARQQEQQQQQQ